MFNYQLHPPPQLYAIQHPNTVIVSPTMVPLRCGFPNNCAENESEADGSECVPLPEKTENGFKLVITKHFLFLLLLQGGRSEVRID